MRRGYVVSMGALAIVAALAVSGVAVGKPVKSIVGNLMLEFDGGFSPKTLPKTKPAPFSFNIWGKISTTDGTHPPALKEFVLEGDKHVAIDVKGVPICKAGEIQSTDSAHARKACGDALVGSGKTEVEIAFPEQKPIRTTSELLAFNGGFKSGVTTLLVHAYITVPTPAAIVTTVKIKKIHNGRYGLKSVASVPKIAGGTGSVTFFSLGIPKGILFATCPDGHLNARGTTLFSDHTRASAAVVRPCTPKR